MIDKTVDDVRVIRAGGICALLGVSAGLAGAVVGAVNGLGGQEVPLVTSTDFLTLVSQQRPYILREWLFLIYAIFAVGEGIGLYFLTRRTNVIALWALVAFSAGILIGVVQDATSVALVRQFPTDYALADATARQTLEPIARMVGATIAVQQSIANLLLGIGAALYSAAVLRGRTASRWFGIVGFTGAAASVLFGIVTATAPRLAALQAFAEHAFGFVVLWDLWAGLIMLRFHPAITTDRRGNHVM